MLCAGRALTGEAFVADDPTFPPVVLEETDFGMRRSGPREADRAGGRLTGWKIAPKYRTIELINLYYAHFIRQFLLITQTRTNSQCDISGSAWLCRGFCRFGRFGSGFTAFCV